MGFSSRIVFLGLILLAASEISANRDSCQGKCGSRFNRRLPCQCNTQCDKFNNCCQDFFRIGCGVSNNDLKRFSEAIFGMSRPSVLNQISRLNVQSRSPQCGQDSSPRRLFDGSKKRALLQIDTIAKLVPLFDNFNANTNQAETVTRQERREQAQFFDAVMATNEMQKAHQFLVQEGVFEGNYASFSSYVKRIWFGLYNRSGSRRSALTSSGFEHVLIGEFKGRKVSGLHNWIRQYFMEDAGQFNYHGYNQRHTYTTNRSTNVTGLTFDYNMSGSKKKCKGSSLVGTTPEMDMALMTVCFMTRADQNCKMTLGTKKIHFKTFKQSYRGFDYIGTAYPIVFD